MARILAIDPGPIECGYVFWDSKKNEFPNMHGIPNKGMLKSSTLDNFFEMVSTEERQDFIAVEAINNYGNIGRSTLETVMVIGKIMAYAETDVLLYSRASVSSFFGAKGDSRIRQALRVMLGSATSSRCCHCAKCKNNCTLTGVSGHIWQALALAVACERIKEW